MMKRTAQITSLVTVPSWRNWMDDLFHSSVSFIRTHLTAPALRDDSEGHNSPFIPKESEQAIFFIEGGGKILRCNDAAEELLGYEASELRGENLSRIITAGSREASDSSWSGTHKNGSVISLAIQSFQFTSGRHASVMVIATPISATDAARHQNLRQINEHLKRRLKQKSEQLERIVDKMKLAVAEVQVQAMIKKQLESELQASRQVFGQLISHFPDTGFYLLSKDFHARALNAYDLKLDADFFSQELRDAISKTFLGETAKIEFSISGKAFLIIATPLGKEKASTDNALLIVRNTTDRKTLEHRLGKMLEREKEMERLQVKSSKVGVVSHKLRTPLSTILAAVFLLENYSTSEFEQEKSVLMEKIKRAVQNITDLLNYLDQPAPEEAEMEKKSGDAGVNSAFLHIIKKSHDDTSSDRPAL